MTEKPNDPAARRWHDMGGASAGPVPMDGHDFALWEKRVDALMVLCGSKGLLSVHGLRRVLEDMGEEAFEKYSYYDRWIAAINQNLVEHGVYTLEELGTRMADVAARGGTYGEATDG
nr:SH3-like domain-containing protein [Pseudohalocynthiibacter aestuariivivens]